MRYRFKLTDSLTDEKNRAQNYITISNLMPTEQIKIRIIADF